MNEHDCMSMDVGIYGFASACIHVAYHYNQYLIAAIENIAVYDMA